MHNSFTEQQLQQETEQWTEIITPRNKLFDLRLKEVWHYRDLLGLFVKRDLAAQYKQTVLGPLWHIVQPVLTTIMFLVVFNKIAHIPTDGIPAVVFYMSGIAMWSYFSTCLTGTSNTFISNAGIFGKVYFPRLITPLSIITSNLIKFSIQFGLLVAAMLYYAYTGDMKIDIGMHTLLIPAVLFAMAGLGLGLGIIISSLTTKYRDLTVLVNFGVGLLMYATPVAYPLSYVEKSSYKTLILLNPLSSLIETFRYAVLGKGTFDPMLFGYSCLFMVVILFFGMIIFGKVEKTFMDTV
ncbi:ABC transporter permease [Panacibacter ginsenosidivorans]|uniref:Transport permease protein n=1 Tax=Panacibacter ginsenosidivorans TaxID=1813871 RepID=A0A5B8VC36_9BACT|nr:ABC transporter permease [Panacibacter ginsenosidivorans]QEC69070.1 ABC transporter permease [Panacibacter ginsenosidivorans]